MVLRKPFQECWIPRGPKVPKYLFGFDKLANTNEPILPDKLASLRQSTSIVRKKRRNLKTFNPFQLEIVFQSKC
jgi:hypothetical protein